ncbi:two-component system sensor histidine kinase MtrB [Thermocatellispora tengchongensis]|uniref:Sensor histidine kinase MtrB n=1 Tax=Thermocatellispora tengchongensis TaxID=1073253 RepID=A0A840PFK7_9ACTN|nr:MtrAB system histidine kinase MtrB [Thermocatellispora tengchongensis]MBB5134825.1 two-component system sensor histidine kinase MtrB [Thermocatellispora tengchongensis]
MTLPKAKDAKDAKAKAKPKDKRKPPARKPKRRTPAQIARGVRRRARRAAGKVRRFWRRSLQLRVVTSTLVISVVVVAVLGFFLMQQITTTIVNGRAASAVTDALADRATIVAQLNQTAEGPEATGAIGGEPGQSAVNSPIDRAANALANRAGDSSRYSVIIRNESLPGEYRATNDIQPRSISAKMRADLRDRQINDTLWQPTSLYYYGKSQPEPGLVIGVKVEGGYEIYHFIPLTEEEQTLQDLRQMLVVVGIGLVVLLAAIASLVTRQVVTPVRLARQAAERLAAGQLEERLKVRGEDDLARLAHSFNEMAANLALKIHQLEELSQVQRQFVSDVSHELRTPLTTVRMAADLLYEAREDFDPAAARSAELMQNQLERFESMLADLLEISRYDAGAATLDIDSVDIRDVVLRAVADSEALGEKQGIRFDLRLPSEPCMADIDSRRVERILRNLLFNAIEHGEGRDVVVTVGADRDAVAVAVRDHGVGLRPGEENLVFDRFWRADPSRARTIGGTGLGLAISREDAMLHGGWLQAWGSPGEGSQFRLSLPRVAGAELRGSPLSLVPPEIEMRRTWRGQATPALPPPASSSAPAQAPAPVDAMDGGAH